MRTALHTSVNGGEVTSRRVTEASVKCGCGDFALLDAEGKCEFCRRRSERVAERTNDAKHGLIVFGVGSVVVALVWWFL